MPDHPQGGLARALCEAVLFRLRAGRPDERGRVQQAQPVRRPDQRDLQLGCRPFRHPRHAHGPARSLGIGRGRANHPRRLPRLHLRQRGAPLRHAEPRLLRRHPGRRRRRRSARQNAGPRRGGVASKPLSRGAQGCPGKPRGESICRSRMPRKTAIFRLLSGLRDSERGRGMRFTPTIFSKLLEPIRRRQFDTLVKRHTGDAYIKSFPSWNHLLALVYAQFSSAVSLRGLAAGWNAHRHHHYHLGSGPLVRSTLSDANKRRPVALFETFSLVASQLDRQTRRDGAQMVKLIDATPIPLGKLCNWAKSNGRIRGLKVHVVFDPKADYPSILDITDANVNDAQIGRTIAIEPGATYVFDKGYCHYGWWTAIAEEGALFVTRPKPNMRLDIVGERPIALAHGDGFTVLEDHEVRFASKGDSQLPIRLRRLRVQRTDGKTITLLTNDLERAAADIAALYKARWQIELLFRWIKQHLHIRRFLGNNDNAIRLQIFAAMIAYALLRIAARRHCVKIPILRFTDLVALCLFERRHLGAIDKPPPVNPSRPQCQNSQNQLSFGYA